MRPVVGLIPTSIVNIAGLTIEPAVSDPTLAAQKLAAVPAPELEPPVLRTGEPSLDARGSARGSYGLNAKPATALKLPGIGVGAPATQLASSVSTVFAMITAPASRRFFASVASYGGMKLAKARAPPVVGMSVVWMLSLSAMGMPCNGPRTRPAARSASLASASSSALGLIVIAALIRLS